VRRCDRRCGPGCLCVCGYDKLAGRCADANANAGSNNVNLNQHYDYGDPYDSQFDSLGTVSGFLH